MTSFSKYLAQQEPDAIQEPDQPGARRVLWAVLAIAGVPLALVCVTLVIGLVAVAV